MKLPYLAIALLILATAYSAMVSFRQPSFKQPRRGKLSWIFPESAGRPVRFSVATLTLALLAALGLLAGNEYREFDAPFLAISDSRRIHRLDKNRV